MFCCDCGAPNPDRAKYCHKCGGILYEIATESKQSLPAPNNPKPELKLTQEQRQLVDKLLSIDKKPNECHACGGTENLHTWNFGLAKKTGTKRDWSMTAATAVVSAITLPLVGIGRLELPGKKTRLNVLRLKLVLCDVCRDANFAYHFHPWWKLAKQLGYTECFDAAQLKKLRPVR